MNTYDVIIIGGGAAGMMAAIESGKKGNSTLLVEQNEKLGKKILVSGGGRCNFTNLYTSPENYLSNNRHFCKSALAQYTQWDFIDLLQQHKISYHEKEAGQLFCDESSRQIVNMLKAELVKASVSIKYKQTVKNVRHEKKLFLINSSDSEFKAKALIIATGGLSFPKLGSNSIGYQIAQSFGHSIIPTHPALVPLTFSEKEKELFSSLSGLSLDVEASAPKSRQSFKGKMLFTHRGISGPAILQVSSYLEHWQEIILNFDPENKFLNWLQEQKKTTPKQHLKTVLSRFFPKSFAWVIIKTLPLDKEIGKLTDLQMQDL